MANKEFNARIRWKKDTSSNWTSNNPVLLDGEIAIVVTNANETRFKVGDGTSAYTELPFQDEPLRTLIAEKLDAPAGGSAGQILEKTETSTQWVDMPESGITQVEADSRYLQLTGGTVDGGLMIDVSDGSSSGLFVNNGGMMNPIFVIQGGQNIISASRPIQCASGSSPTSDLVLVNKQYVDNAVANAGSKPTATLVTLSSSGWSSNSQTVTVSGVLADESAQMIQPMPTIASQSAYIEAGILCTNQAANSLTFTCQTVPTSNLTVYVVIQPLS